jgi:hypothetical protein
MEKSQQTNQQETLSLQDQSKQKCTDPNSPYMTLAKKWDTITINPQFIELWHIKKVDSVPVMVHIRKYQGGMSLHIHATHVKEGLSYDDSLWCYYKSGNFYYKSIEEIAITLEIMANRIGDLRYNQYTCKLDIQDNITETQCIFNIFNTNNIPTVETTQEQCCICHEPTCVTTQCRHYVCVPCADKYIDTTHRTSCPMCRNPNGLAKSYTPQDRANYNFYNQDDD